MATPTKKNPEIEAFIDQIFGKAELGRVESIKNDVCVGCEVDVLGPLEFEDELSKKEYTISGLCQECQNEVFGENE